jgi:hypothetical protein
MERVDRGNTFQGELRKRRFAGFEDSQALSSLSSPMGKLERRQDVGERRRERDGNIYLCWIGIVMLKFGMVASGRNDDLILNSIN